jgi:hypothetical protein
VINGLQLNIPPPSGEVIRPSHNKSLNSIYNADRDW